MKKIKINFKLFSLFVVSLCLALCLTFGITKFSDVNSIDSYAVRYADANEFVNSLINDPTSVETEYDLRNECLILPENQTSSDFCWIYASMKALETTIEKATQEHYNFSELAAAMFYYYDTKDSGTQTTINVSGNFEIFNNIVSNYGLVFESEFSNDKFFDITESNSENYRYCQELARDNIFKAVSPLTFSNSQTYKNFNSTNQKANVLKKFIQKYGGVFVGLERGTIQDNPYGGWIFKGEVDENITSGKYFYSGHSVCVVGWNENGFIALNSWGVGDNSCTYFYIPYSYEYMYDYSYGYIYNNDVEQVVLSETTALTPVLNTSIIQKNIFSPSQTIKLTYSFSRLIEFSNLYIEVWKGSENVTRKFVVSFKDTERQVSLTFNESNADGTDYIGGTYVIKFYQDVVSLGSKSFSVLSGTEVSYISLTKNSIEEGYSMLSANETSENISTYYIAYDGEYHINFYFSYLTKFLNDTPTVTVGNVYSYSTNAGSIIKTLTTLNFNVQTSYDSMSYILLNKLNDYVGKRLEFNLNVSSSKFGLAETYVINLFLSSDSQTTTKNARSIEYVLDGGLNSTSNVSKFPVYENESSMTFIELFSPSKNSYRFIGWYLDGELKNEIKYISPEIKDDLVVYAKWERFDVNYFQTNFQIVEVKHYDQTIEPYTSEMALAYGDSLKLKFDFVELDNLKGYSYSLKYYLFANGDEVQSETITETGSHIFNFELNFPDLGAGDYQIRLLTSVVISHSASEEKEDILNVSISKKLVNFVFDNEKMEKTYNGEFFSPISLGAISFDGVYDEDLTSFEYQLSDTEKKNAGEYTYFVKSITNPNYSYDKNKSGTLIINKKLVSVIWSNLLVEYNGVEQKVGYKIEGLLEGEQAELELDGGSQSNVGKHRVFVSSVTNPNYYVAENTQTEFEITPANIVIAFDDISERLQTAPIYRKQVTYRILSGRLFGDDELDLEILCDGLKAKKSGKYKISGYSKNSNYNLYVNDAIYTLTGYYFVYYTLPDGEIYTEIVEDGKNPKGMNKDILDKPAFSYYSYSQKLENIGEDLHITVTVINYLWAVIVVSVVVVFGGAYWFVTRKQRRNKIK